MKLTSIVADDDLTSNYKYNSFTFMIEVRYNIFERLFKRTGPGWSAVITRKRSHIGESAYHYVATGRVVEAHTSRAIDASILNLIKAKKAKELSVEYARERQPLQ